MHPFDDDYLSKMLPGFEKKPRSETAAPPQKTEPPAATVHETPVATVHEAAEIASSPQPTSSELFDSLAAYIRTYLLCDQHQLTVLTLWAAYTRCFKAFRTAVYLNLRSPEPQSGKSLCLMLLNEFAHKPSFYTGISAGALLRFHLTKSNLVDGNKFENTLFLDDCHHTFGPSERQPAVALLNSGSNASPCYCDGKEEYYLFGPKAFAGNAPLPRSLASRSIPITLLRRKSTDTFTRFHPAAAREDSLKLVEQLAPWIENHRAAIEEVALTIPKQIPPGLAPREQACAEPLIHLADLIGGPWPDKARAALAAIFKVAEDTQTVELLSDIRALFLSKGDPECIGTKDLLAALTALDHRPWARWTRSSGQKISTILRPFGIAPRGFHSFRGYKFKDFQDTWERYTPPITVGDVTENGSVTGSVTEFPL